MHTLKLSLLALLSVGLLSGCLKDEQASAEKPAVGANEKPAPKPAEKPGAKPAEKPATKSGKVFDPKTPPQGFVNCHRGHCHRVGGGVASYAQVMKEMGATEMVGGMKAPKMPAAPADVSAPPADAEKSKTGVASKVLSKGTGARKPSATDTVTVHYTGWTTDGKAFDSSVARGKPVSFPLNRVIPGWTEGLQLMVEGEERRLWIPQELAYRGQPGMPAGMLVFDVTLIKIQ